MHALMMSAGISAGISAATAGLPFFHLGALDVGVPIQWFGMIVAAGVLIGATPLRRYAEWHGVSDAHIRSLLTWIMISGFLGAHEFDVVAYQWDRLGDSTVVPPASWWFLPAGLWPSNWPLVLRFWDGISSYGGFVGGAIGFALFVWWKRLPVRLFADISIVGLLPAFTIGRIGCTVVSDHTGAYVDPSHWYAFLAMDYPRKLNWAHLADSYPLSTYPGTADLIRAWNLGLVEFLYLIPVNLIVLWLAFRPSKRLPAGFVAVLTGILYAPVRFFLDFLRPEDTDPRYLGLTFAQWASIVALGVALYAARRVLKAGVVAETVAPTSREAQERLRIILREDDEALHKQRADARVAERNAADLPKARAVRDTKDAKDVKATETTAADAEATAADALAGDAPADDEQADDEADEPAPAAAAGPPAAAAATPTASKAAAAKPSGNRSANRSSNRSGGNKSKKSRKR